MVLPASTLSLVAFYRLSRAFSFAASFFGKTVALRSHVRCLTNAVYSSPVAMACASLRAVISLPRNQVSGTTYPDMYEPHYLGTHINPICVNYSERWRVECLTIRDACERYRSCSLKTTPPTMGMEAAKGHCLFAALAICVIATSLISSLHGLLRCIKVFYCLEFLFAMCRKWISGLILFGVCMMVLILRTLINFTFQDIYSSFAFGAGINILFIRFSCMLSLSF